MAYRIVGVLHTNYLYLPDDGKNLIKSATCYPANKIMSRINDAEKTPQLID